jgi:hypothetical protein
MDEVGATLPGETRYVAYLLRVWVRHRNGEITCRAVLVDPHTGEERVFADLESLICYLRTAVETRPIPPPG